MFGFQKKNWPEFVQKAKGWLYEGGRKASWVIKTDPVVSARLKSIHHTTPTKVLDVQLTTYNFLKLY